MYKYNHHYKKYKDKKKYIIKSIKKCKCRYSNNINKISNYIKYNEKFYELQNNDKIKIQKHKLYPESIFRYSILYNYTKSTVYKENNKLNQDLEKERLICFHSERELFLDDEITITYEKYKQLIYYYFKNIYYYIYIYPYNPNFLCSYYKYNKDYLLEPFHHEIIHYKSDDSDLSNKYLKKHKNEKTILDKSFNESRFYKKHHIIYKKSKAKADIKNIIKILNNSSNINYDILLDEDIEKEYIEKGYKNW